MADTPGVKYRDSDLVTPRSQPTALDTMLLIQAMAKGPALVTDLHSLADYIRERGGRTTKAQSAYDGVDKAFEMEGPATIHTSRLFGPTPVQAFKVLKDGTNADTLKYVANEWDDGNNIEIEITGTSPVVLNVYYDEDGDGVKELVETFTAASRAACISATANGVYGKLIATGASSALPVAVVKGALAGGTDDVANATVTQWVAAAKTAPRNLGVGQVVTPDLRDAAIQGAIADVVADRNRVYPVDAPATTTFGTLDDYIDDVRDLGSVAQVMYPCWPPLPCDGVVPGTTRTIAASVIEAARLARNDRAGEMPNQPAAGDLGIVTPWVRSDALATMVLAEDDWATLNAKGLAVFIEEYGDIKMYGSRGPADPDTYPLSVFFGAARMRMAVKALLGVVAARYVHQTFDRNNVQLKDLAADGAKVLKPYVTAGAISGLVIDTGPSQSVNPVSELQAGRVKIVARWTDAFTAETVTIETVRSATTPEEA